MGEQEREREPARERELGSLELLHEKGVESGSGSSRVRESLRGSGGCGVDKEGGTDGDGDEDGDGDGEFEALPSHSAIKSRLHVWPKKSMHPATS